MSKPEEFEKRLHGQNLVCISLAGEEEGQRGLTTQTQEYHLSKALFKVLKAGFLGSMGSG